MEPEHQNERIGSVLPSQMPSTSAGPEPPSAPRGVLAEGIRRVAEGFSRFRGGRIGPDRLWICNNCMEKIRCFNDVSLRLSSVFSSSVEVIHFKVGVLFGYQVGVLFGYEML